MNTNFFKEKISKFLIDRSIEYQKKSSLRDLDLWGLKVNKSGNLSVNSCDCIDLVEKYGTPLLVVNSERLTKDATQICSALASASFSDGSKVLYSYKTNCTPGILKLIHKYDIGAEVISAYELWLAEKLGIPGKEIVYNGVDKSEESIFRAVNMGILTLNIDHREEIQRIYSIAKKVNKRLNVGIRLGFNCRSQFGLEIDDEAIEVCRQIAKLSDFLNLNCVHFNVTSNAKRAKTHKETAIKALRFISMIRGNLGIQIEYLDIGGGFGVPTTKNMSGSEYGIYRAFGCLPKPPSPNDFQDIDSFVKEIYGAIKEECNSLKLKLPKILIEPGRFIISRAQFLLAKVNSVKKRSNGTIFALTDAGRLSLTFPCDFEYHEVFIAGRPHSEMNSLYNIMGRICTSADWMFKNRILPELKSGDVLAVMDAGAYFSSYSSNFAFPRSAIVVVEEGYEYLIKKRETFEHMVSMDIF